MERKRACDSVESYDLVEKVITFKEDAELDPRLMLVEKDHCVFCAYVHILLEKHPDLEETA